MNIQLQPSTAEDRSWLEELRRKAYLDLFVATWGDWDEARHKRHWASCLDKGHISIVKLDGTYAGMVQVLEEKESVEIAEIQILPEFQGKGIGTQVLSDIVEGAHSNRRPATLSVGKKNGRAIALYRSLGFVVVKETDAKIYFKLSPST